MALPMLSPVLRRPEFWPGEDWEPDPEPITNAERQEIWQEAQTIAETQVNPNDLTRD